MVWAEYAADTYEPVLALLEHYELCFQLSGPVTNGKHACRFFIFRILFFNIVVEICFADGSSLFPSLLDDLPLQTPPPIVEVKFFQKNIISFVLKKNNLCISGNTISLALRTFVFISFDKCIRARCLATC